MLALLVAAGAIPEAPPSTMGPFDVAKDRIAFAARLQPSAAMGAGIPYGSAIWAWPFDPVDHLPYGFSFEALLDPDETIVTIERIALSSAGAALGVMIDQAPGFAPVIDEDQPRRIQLWFSIDPALQTSPPFDAAGAQIPVMFQVMTSKQHRLGRTAVLNVRQL